MKIKSLIEDVAVPEGNDIFINDKILKIKGPKGELIREFSEPLIGINVENHNVVIKSLARSLKKKDKRNFRTIRAHIKNMINGVNKGYVYKLKVCSGHFPITVNIEGNSIVVKNFLGEKVPRRLKFEGVKVSIDGDIISVNGNDKELVGNTSASIERLTKIKGRDKRIFQDGCYIISKE